MMVGPAINKLLTESIQIRFTMDSKRGYMDNNRSTMIRVLDGIYGVSFILGPLALPFVLLLGKNVEDRWISFVFSVIFIIVLIIKRKPEHIAQ